MDRIEESRGTRRTTLARTAQHRPSFWCPLLIGLGIVTMAASLDFIPVGSALFFAAFVALGREGAVRAVAGSPSGV